MGKTSPYRGTTKKAIKAEEKAKKYYAETGVKEHKAAAPVRKRAQRRVEDIAKGKNLGPVDIKSLTKEMEAAQKYAKPLAEKEFADIERKAISDYQRYTQPSIAAQFQPRNSAAKQALKQSSEDLHTSLASNFANLKNSIAGNYLNQLTNNRQFGANAMLQANSGLMGNQISPISGGHVPSYNQPQGGTSGIGGDLIGGGLNALGIWGAAGFPGLTSASAPSIATTIAPIAATAFASSKDVKENIKEYTKGLETIRELDVKNYDYTIDVPGRKDNRVGLIAEDIPEELQVMLADVRAVDVYGLVGLLVNCVKQLDEKVKALEAK